MRRCFFCDTQNPDTAVNCKSCGAALTNAAPAAASEDAGDTPNSGEPTGGPWPQLSDAQLEAIVTELKQGRKIQAIKLLREATGMGLKEAKDGVEALARQRGLPGGSGGGCAGMVLLCLAIPLAWAVFG